jgi:hypothetical protein
MLVRFDTGNSSEAEHYGRVEAEGRRDHRRDDEHHSQQPASGSAAEAPRDRSRVVENALFLGQMGQHQDGGEERHGWTKRGKLPGDVPPRDQTKNPHHNGTWQGGDQLRKTPGTDHREDQDGREDEQGQRRAHTHRPHPDRLPSSGPVTDARYRARSAQRPAVCPP